VSGFGHSAIHCSLHSHLSCFHYWRRLYGLVGLVGLGEKDGLLVEDTILFIMGSEGRGLEFWFVVFYMTQAQHSTGKAKHSSIGS
jgi:hypothetical protein